MLKKVARTLDEMSKNEELMQGILAAAEDGIDAAEGQVIDDDKEPRLRTIGEDGEEDRHFDTNKGESKGLLQNNLGP